VPDRGDIAERRIEMALRAIAAGLDFPPTPDLAAAVAARLQPERDRVDAAIAPRPALRVIKGSLRPVVRGPVRGWIDGSMPGWQRAVAAVAAALIVFSGVLALSPGARHAVATFLGIGGEKITIVPITPTPPVRRLGEGLDLGLPESLAAAERQVAFSVIRPRDPVLGPPDQVFVSFRYPDGQVSLVYRARPGIPRADETGVGLLLSEFPGRIDRPLVEKMLGPGTTIAAVTVKGHPGFWITGAPHEFMYRGPNGEPVPETIRLAGNVLLWEQGGLTVRIESALSEAEALRIAESVR
jgi:hypothetical protein